MCTDIIVYTDGSYIPEVKTDIGPVDTSSICGCAYLIKTDHGLETKKFVIESHSQRQILAECWAVIEALEYLKTKIEKYKGRKIIVHADYVGAIFWADGTWKAGNIYTQEYVRKIRRLIFDLYAYDCEVTFQKVNGHSGNMYNDIVDESARKAVENWAADHALTDYNENA